MDTIYANDKKNVALFFPEPIRQGITGTSNFVFTYNREKEQYFGLLQATPGTESNLLTVTKNGQVYSYILKFKEQLPKLNYFITAKESIGKEKPGGSPLFDKKNLSVDNKDKSYYYHQFCSYLLKGKQPIKRLKRQNEKIALSIKNIVFDREELYFVIQIENNSSLDYDVNFLNMSVKTRKKGKNKSIQKLYQEPVFEYQTPLKVAKNESKQLVYVLPKFSISNERSIILELNEKCGERNLKLNISNRYINNPN